ncbi:MAG: hypothetical protein JNL33_16130 [Betaproteobacteria bacterium]|nr:hypothetical protein [Betaproteobacteria bacterium]
MNSNVQRHLLFHAFLACTGALGLAGPAMAAVGIQYGIEALINDYTQAPTVTQSRDLNSGQLPIGAAQSAAASRLDADGYSIGNISFDAPTGRFGLLANTLSGTPSKEYVLRLGSNYDDAVSVATLGTQAATTQIALTLAVEGDFAGSATQGGVTMTFYTATGQSAFLQLSRRPDPVNPGFDEFMSWSNVALPPSITLVQTGVAQHFSETLTLAVPVTAVPAASQTLYTGLISSLQETRDPACSGFRGCGRMLSSLDDTPAPTIEFSIDITASSTSGRGMPLGDSLVDLTHTATLGVEVPDDAYFLLASGALADDPKSVYAILPVVAVPEPAEGVLILAGLGLLFARHLGGRMRASTISRCTSRLSEDSGTS